MNVFFTDHLNNSVEFNFPPQRVVSLVPSQTELLCDLGLGDRVVGITKFCIHPEKWFKGKTKVGGTKKVNIEVVKSLKPDLIIGNKEENTKEDIEALQELFPVWMSDIHDLEEAKKTILDIGALTDRAPEASYLVDLISSGFRDIASLGPGSTHYNKSVLYLIWNNPYMVAGPNTFINDVLEIFGLRNAMQQSRYPEISIEDLQDLQPDYVFLSSEPYPFKEKHIQEISQMLPNTKVLLVDGEMFSWYGSRLVKSIQYLFELRTQLQWP